MRKYPVQLTLLVLLVSIMITACVPSNTAPTPTLFQLPTPVPDVTPTISDADSVAPVAVVPTPTPLFGNTAQTSTPDLHQRGPCEHLLWPLRSGSTWTYNLSESSATLILSADTTEVGAQLSAGGQRARLICGDGTLAGLPPIPFAHPALGGGVVGNNPDGSYLPSGAVLLPLGPGVRWDQEVEAAGAIVLPPLAGDNRLSINGGLIVISNETEALVTVDTPAGQFMTLPVRQEILMDLLVQTEGVQVERILINTLSHSFFSEEAGLVRIAYEGGTISSDAGSWNLEDSTTLDLISYDHP